MDCQYCGVPFKRSRPDANNENYCSIRCRFMSGIKVSELGCWEWQRATFKSGYGAMRVEGKVATVHRIAFGLFRGPIPFGKFVLHRCDNYRCANPEHLFIGTHQDNMTDAASKGRAGMSGKRHRDETKEAIRRRHAGKPPAWLSNPDAKRKAYAKALETRRERYGQGGGNGKGAGA